MNKKNIFNFQELEVGDVVKFIPYGSQKESLGIIYRLISNPDGTRKAGARVIEAITKGANIRIPEGEEDSHTKIPSVLREFGATPTQQMLQFSHNLRTLANVPQMTGHNRKDDIIKVGSIASHTIFPKLFGHFEKLYAGGKLQMDGKPLLAAHKREIQSRQYARNILRNDRISREEMLHRLQQEFGQSAGGLSLNNALQNNVQRLTIARCVEKGFISDTTANFITDLSLEKTGPVPRFFKDAVPLATTHKGQERLTKLFGLTSRGKLFDMVVSEVKDLATLLGMNPK